MHSRKPELEQRHISVWQSVFDATYTSSSAAGAVDDYAGWTDSGGRQQIPDPDMREWADDAAASVSALRPGRLLEVGCGTGLLLRRLAHDCRYVGTDLSAAALTRAAAASDATVEGLHQLPAHEIDSLGGGFDAVVLNSVVQYFPGLDYLRDVLHQAVEAVAGTGHVFVGDVRHVDLLDAQAAAELDAGEGVPLDPERLRHRVRAHRQGNELAVRPTVFEEIHPRVTNVRVRPKTIHPRTAMARFRYDVVLTVDGQPPQRAGTSRAWETIGSNEALRVLVEEFGSEARGAESLEITGIANANIRASAGTGSERGPAHRWAIGPRDLRQLVESHGLASELSWRSCLPDGSFDAVLHRGAEGVEIGARGSAETEDAWFTSAAPSTSPLDALRRVHTDFAGAPRPEV
ncbi:class I SAM-dependent methyltransferase [Streptomyces sp. NBC_01717]|uniref:class I SAM-dependent methyltransferase n=1 Tax=Streptomyces sp. NBC_01717 TaxID=2975918 RepID=UPI002E2FE036|nr:class I SAM-dependent methyltransferase [Streptomyces sp. NBC_01717]